ncbi:branched-chain amino acid ABC transporter permease [Marinobacter vinifirmus]|jgi:branched-chain amino acid transport system permease protein|uniref:Branched-chain amino acid ABC transporter permease n=1 Tax=Marinobacter vinifirmus TaxID=355591 RepID=A0A558BCY4_9GAMM|nr:branched-chain amino acid ABC transporter permease [Marinobacter vinifirmus]TVT34355.1 MAG: branched-chain amino acid ABC transporter permease [Marinobacter vinifirmus]
MNWKLFAIFVAILGLFPFLWSDPYVLSVMGSAGIMIIAAISLNLLLGYTGQLSLGHAAFFGIGAYTSALMSLGFDIDIGFGMSWQVDAKPVWMAFATAILVTAFFGWLVGKLAFKVRGAYFVVITISFAQVMRMISLNWTDLTEGPMGMISIPPLNLWVPGEGLINLTSKAAIYWLVLAVGVIAYLLVAMLVNSRQGRAMIALRENETLATSVGIPVTYFLSMAAIISAAIAGAAGGLYAHTVRIIDPDVFLFIYTVTMVIMVVAGGKGTLGGPIIGGLIFGLMPELLRGVVQPEVQWVIYGITMIIILLFLPRGLVPAIYDFIAWLRSPVAISQRKTGHSLAKEAN